MTSVLAPPPAPSPSASPSPAAAPSSAAALDEVPASVPCAHCGLPAPAGGDGPAFCCSGCRGAYALIHEWDLGDYYALRDRLGGRATRPDRDSKANGDRFAELDEPAVHGANARDLADGTRAVRLAVDGLHCGACAWLIERTVPLVGGWLDARVDLPRRRCEVTFDPTRTTLSRIARSLAAFGYRLRPLPESTDDDGAGGDGLTDDPDRPARLRRIAAAGFCFANAMWLAVALYAGRDGSLEPEHGWYLAAFGAALAVAAVLGPGRVFLRSAWASVRTRTPHIDLPIAVGLAAGAGAGAIELLTTPFGTATPEVWFDSVCGLVFFLLLGRELQARGQGRAAAAVRALAALRPPLARRVGADGAVRSVRAGDLVAGDVVEVRPGEVAPADGVLIEGTTELDRSLLTGEADPVPVALGDPIAAGVRNLTRTIRMRCEATGGATRVAGLSRLVGETLSTRTPLVRQVDRIGAWFVLAVLLTAAVTGAAVRLGTGSTPEAARRAIAVLVVACPCAVSLATPLAIAVAVGRAANRGILVRRGDLFERLGGAGVGAQEAGVVWFDKTGTLTEGRPVLAEWIGDESVLSLAAAVEADSGHPVARALCEAAEARGLRLPSVSDVEHGPRGVRGTADGTTVRVGSAEFLRSEGVVVPATLADAAAKLAAAGRSPGFASIGARAVAAFGVGDRLRPGAANAVAALRARGWRVGVLSGDDPAAVRTVAGAAGIDPADARGGLSPEEKLAIVRETSSQNGSPTAFVGDGVNDAAALAAADVGIATGGAAEASLQAAGAFCPGGPADVPALLEASRATVRAVRRLLLVSLGYNLLATAGAAAGVVGPLGAAALMPLSSLLVTGLAFASRTFPAEPTSFPRDTRA